LPTLLLPFPVPFSVPLLKLPFLLPLPLLKTLALPLSLPLSVPLLKFPFLLPTLQFKAG
jgi:hypothetical protein